MRQRLNEQDDDDRRPVMQRCPSCGARFRVLADEAGMHDCPRCGWGPNDGNEEEEHDPHCTCNDCIEAHIASLEEEDDHTEHDDTPRPARLGDFEDGR